MGGTEAFPDLVFHCQHLNCKHLDFLPFHCNACNKVFCLEHRSYSSHLCPTSESTSRKVIICDSCNSSIEITGIDEKEEASALRKHQTSGNCDPSKKNTICPVKRCKTLLTLSNTSLCKTCGIQVCLKHRFPLDHDCLHTSISKGSRNLKFMIALASRERKKNCRTEGASPPNTPHSVKAC